MNFSNLIAFSFYTRHSRLLNADLQLLYIYSTSPKITFNSNYIIIYGQCTSQCAQKAGTAVVINSMNLKFKKIIKTKQLQIQIC